MKVTVLSDGAWGTALAMVLCDNGCNVTQWGPFPDYLETMASTRSNPRFLPGVNLPAKLHFNPDIKEAVKGSSMLVLATPTQYLRQVLAQLKPHFQPSKQLIVNVAKGIEIDSWLRVSEITESVLGRCRYVALSGPSHAEEVSRKIPTLVVAASKNATAARLVQQTLMNDYFRVYTSNDPVGVELGGALKNVMAIAAGIIDGMELGDNPKAALITRGIAEMSRLGVRLGGKRATFSGLSGVGDLIVTCCSGHSRNRHVGEELGRGKKLPQILKEMGMVIAEGVTTARGAKHFLDHSDAEAPILAEVYSILYEYKDPKTAIRDLMTRAAKPEQF